MARCPYETQESQSVFCVVLRHTPYIVTKGLLHLGSSVYINAIMFTYIHLKHLNRNARFPYLVEDTGHLYSHCTKPETYRYNKLEVCLRLSGNDDSATDQFNGQTYTTPYPHVVWKMPGWNHSFHACDHREALFFTYSQKTARQLATDGYLPEHPLQPITLTEDLKKQIRCLNSLMAISEEYGSADKIDLTCFAILEELLFQRNMSADVLDDRIRKIASLLQINADGMPDIAKIANEYGFPERSFYRQWNKVFAITPARYIFQQKMQRAQWLLTHTSMKISEIAAMLSFCDDNSFSTAFKRFFGQSPSSCRNTYLTKQ